MREGGWRAQVTAAKSGPPENAPRLTIDAAMLLVEEKLAALGSAASCTREEVALAFNHLTDPLVGAAVWSDTTRDAIVILST